MSDQDFFFDEEEKDEKSAPKGEKTSVKHTSSRSASRASSSQSAGGQTISMTVALLMSVIGVLLGIVIGMFLSSVVGAGSNQSATNNGSSATMAPALTDQQIQGGLPAGHPGVNGSTSASGTGQ